MEVFVLKKENGKWMISKFELPKDKTETKVEAVPEGQLPAGVSQDQINKALEQSKDK